MNIRRVSVVMLVGISALSFCYNASSYTSAMVTSPATICITTNDQALIGILGIHMDEPGFYLSVKNNMAKPITISNLSVSLQDSDKEVQKDLDIKIISKDIVKIPIDISEILDNSTPRKTQKGTIAIDSSWKGGEAKINYPFEVIWNGPEGQSDKEKTYETPKDDDALSEVEPHLPEESLVKEQNEDQQSNAGQD